MTSSQWYANIPAGTVVCLQASDMLDEDHVNSMSSIKDLMLKYPMSEQLYDGIKRFEFEDKAFNRVMIIGIK
jgi:pyoverdine/dityrosine biosynthesis protein Dit1